MKSLSRRSLTMAAGVLLTWGIVCALEVPPLRGRINDFAGLLSQDQTSLLENQLSSFERQSGHQIVLLTLESLQDEELASFALKTAEQWKLGQKGHDNWALLLVAVRDRKLRIEVGYGLEGTLPDATANQIINQVIVPQFREKDFASGLESGLAAIMQATRGEPIATVPQNATRPRTSALSSILLLLVGSGLIATVVGFASPSPMRGAVTGGIVAAIVGLPGFFAVGSAVWLLAVFVGVLASSLVSLYTRRAWGRSWSVKPSRNDDFSPRDTFRHGYGGGSGGYGGSGSSSGSGGSSSGGFSGGGGGGGGGGGASGGW